MTFNEACNAIECTNCHRYFTDHASNGSCLFSPGTQYSSKHPKATWEALQGLIADGKGSSKEALLTLLTGRPYELKKRPKYGDKMTAKSFIDSAKSGFFSSYDGHGYYAVGNMMTDVPVGFTESEPPRPEFTHVIWFNK